MDQVLERIAAWEAAGLIDSETAARLRLAEAERPAEQDALGQSAANETQATADAPPQRGQASLTAVFGPGVTLGEMFAYLGGAFLLGAYEAFVVRLAGSGDRAEIPIATGALVATVALGIVGMNLRRGDARRRRAAGVMFALAVAHFGAFGTAVAVAATLEWPVVGIIGAALATLAAIGFRLLHAGLVTQIALLVSVTSLAGVVLSWLEQLVFPQQQFDDATGLPISGGPDPILLVVVSAVWWLALAVIVGLLGLREADAADEDPGAGRRAALTRLWAGLIAVIGLATSVTRSGSEPFEGFHRIIEPWAGELTILLLAAILVERAFRREASAYVYAAALGLMIALSDFNFTYLSSSTELGLLLEGLILLAAGFGADRLRRRLERPAPPATTPDAPEVPAAPAG